MGKGILFRTRQKRRASSLRTIRELRVFRGERHVGAESEKVYLFDAGGGMERSGAEPRTDGRQTSRPDGHLTKTQRELLRYIAGETALHGGVCCTKRRLAELTGRNVKTIDRCIAGLRAAGVIEAEMRFGENGAQLPSRYRVVAMATNA